MNPRRLFRCQLVLIGLFMLLGMGLLATSAEETRLDCQSVDCPSVDSQAPDYRSLVGELGDSPHCCL